MCWVASGSVAVIRIDPVWIATVPADMRADADRLLARVVQVSGAAQAHHGYFFGNERGTRVKLLLHDGMLRAARRLNLARPNSCRVDATANGHHLRVSPKCRSAAEA